jgi:hypothetical protein
MTYFAQHNQDVHANYTSSNEHVPEIERSVRVIKERIRATFHRPPYNPLPKIMIKMLVSESAKSSTSSHPNMKFHITTVQG